MLSGPPPCPLIWTYLLGLKQSIWTVQVLSYQIRNRREKTKSQRTAKTSRNFMREARWRMCREHFSNLPMRLREAGNGKRESMVRSVLFIPLDQASEMRQSDSFNTLRFTLSIWGWVIIEYLLCAKNCYNHFSMIHSNHGWRFLDTERFSKWLRPHS